MLKQVLLVGIIGGGLLLAGRSYIKPSTSTSVPSTSDNSLRVSNQKTGSAVSIKSASLKNQGFVMLLKTDEKGNPTDMVGVSDAFSGQKAEIPIKLMDSFKSGDKLVAMLHTDANTNGKFEWPGVDEPINDKDGLAIMQDFKLE